jgi:hypothetical protein
MRSLQQSEARNLRGKGKKHKESHLAAIEEDDDSL